MANRLETTWKELASIFDERSSVLSLSAVFHQKAEQYVDNVPKWNAACEISSVSTDITTLESTIHQHQALYETMCQAYTEVHRYVSSIFSDFAYSTLNWNPFSFDSTSKKLLYQLDHLVQLCKQPNTEERPHVSILCSFCY